MPFCTALVIESRGIPIADTVSIAYTIRKRQKGITLPPRNEAGQQQDATKDDEK
jgi:hypothetical protein